MNLEIRNADIGAKLDGASNPMVKLTNVEMELWMVRNFLCEIAANWSIEEINEILNTTSLTLIDSEASNHPPKET